MEDQGPEREPVTELLREWGKGDAAALEQLVPIVYEDLHRLARRRMRSMPAGATLQATALVNEVYLRLVRGADVRWQDRAHFFAIGALTIQGTPPDSATGTYPVTITAQNGVGVVATQTLNLTVVKITGPAPLSGSSCNGNYNGTFVGTLTVGAGQNCSFLGGGVTGNVNVQGGNLLLNGSRVTGNVAVQGGASFSLGNGTSIGGNLTVQSTSSAAASKACGTTVAGNVTVSLNSTPISLGTSDGTCAGNTFQTNATVNSNSSVKVYGNRVDKTLACSGNTSIAGAGNTAAKKQGQCASF